MCDPLYLHLFLMSFLHLRVDKLDLSDFKKYALNIISKYKMYFKQNFMMDHTFISCMYIISFIQ